MKNTWDLSFLYKSFEDEAFQADLARLPEAIAEQKAMLDKDTYLSSGGHYGDGIGASISVDITADGITAAAVTLSLIPIVALYPFVQRFLIKGITIGSVKG